MDTYVLIVLVALFLGVMGIIAMMERRRRTELAQAEQLHQTLTACVGWLQAIHSGGESQMGKVAEALSQLQIAVETGTKSSSESAKALSSEAARTVEKAIVRLESALLQHQKAQDAASQSVAAKLSEVTQSTSKEVLAETKRMTKAVQDLQASLEASAKF
jgi:hypothetical protein